MLTETDEIKSTIPINSKDSQDPTGKEKWLPAPLTCFLHLLYCTDYFKARRIYLVSLLNERVIFVGAEKVGDLFHL